ncbi:hypothetical protein cand_002460 [Cryptosporidium andersoni]|uniref:UBC core domain-containing protein n=1 Tax=Cryptosporidium andersoni TaxID=117008 RepID=A0A1J4MR49_9CRYT|nr:hypothetical protein cand_002460 [Cryptosporidium andersoni]
MIGQLLNVAKKSLTYVIGKRGDLVLVKDIHKNRIKNEIEQLRSNQCPLSNCEIIGYNGQGSLNCHYHVHKVIMDDAQNTSIRNHWILIDISIVLEKVGRFQDNRVNVEILLYKDFPFSPPDIIFPKTFCFPSLSDGRSYISDILHYEWSPSITLLSLINKIQDFLLDYHSYTECIGYSDIYIGSYRSVLCFNYQCTDSVIYPIYGFQLDINPETYKNYISKKIQKLNISICKKSTLRITDTLYNSFLPIPLNKYGIIRQSSTWQLDESSLIVDLVFSRTNIMICDSTLTIVESGINNITNRSASSSYSESTSLQGSVILWMYISAITHIIDHTGKLLWGYHGTVPQLINDKISNSLLEGCCILVISYDPSFDKSAITLFKSNEIIQIPKMNTNPTILQLRLHNNKSEHEQNCCLSFMNAIITKISKLGNNFPNIYNSNWDTDFQIEYLTNLVKTYESCILDSNIIDKNSSHMLPCIIYRWLVLSSKLVELLAHLEEDQDNNKNEIEELVTQEHKDNGETIELLKSQQLVSRMQQILVNPIVKNILNKVSKNNITVIDKYNQEDMRYNQKSEDDIKQIDDGISIKYSDEYKYNEDIKNNDIKNNDIKDDNKSNNYTLNNSIYSENFTDEQLNIIDNQLNTIDRDHSEDSYST